MADFGMSTEKTQILHIVFTASNKDFTTESKLLNEVFQKRFTEH